MICMHVKAANSILSITYAKSARRLDFRNVTRAPSLPAPTHLQNRNCVCNYPGPADILPLRRQLPPPPLLPTLLNLFLFPSLPSLDHLRSWLIWTVLPFPPRFNNQCSGIRQLRLRLGLVFLTGSPKAAKCRETPRVVSLKQPTCDYGAP